MSQRTLHKDAKIRWQEFEPNDLLSQIRVHVYCAYRSALGPVWQTERAQDAKDRLYYVLAGSGEIRHHGQTFALKPGSLYLIPAHTPHSRACAGKLELYWCHFVAETGFGTPLFANLPVPYVCHPTHGKQIRASFARMTRLYRDDSPDAIFYRSGLLMQLLSPFIARADLGQWQQWHLRAERFLPVLELIDRRVSETLSSEELACAAKLSRCYFMSRFKQVFGLAPHQYQLLKRIERARGRLLKTSDTLDHISSDLGFADAYHLSRIFKKVTGRSPQAFRSDHASETSR